MNNLLILSGKSRRLCCLGFCLALICFAVGGTIRLSAEEKKTEPAKAATKEAAKDTETEQKTLAGHSYHGEAFNEGPRQKAYLMKGTGKVHLTVTTKNPEVQKYFDQGLGQLHGFWFLEAERSFRHAASLDPDCAMAYWGAALATKGNAKRSKGFIAEAVKRKAKADKREAMFIDTLNAYLNADAKKKTQRNDAYTKAMENIILAYPDELEAKAFLALHLYLTRKASTSYFAVNALIEDILAVEPFHPVHHFRIHLWDYRKPDKALSSAARCGQSAPNIAHMWHMPGHIYSRLKRYNDACWQQEASARVDHANMMHDGVMPDQIHNFAHNNEWLIRNLIFVGRVHDAVDLAKNMTQLPRHPRYNTMAKRGSANYGRRRLLQVLRTYELWDDIIALKDTPYLEPTEVEDEQVKRLRYLGLAYFQKGDIKNGDVQIAELQRRLDEMKSKKEKAEKAAREKAEKAAQAKAAKEKKDQKKDDKKKADNKSIDKAVAAAGKTWATKIRKLEGNLNALKGHREVANKKYKTGYDLLKKAGGVDQPYLARVQWLAGEKEQAEKSLNTYVNSHNNEVQPLAVLVETLWQSGKKKEAKTAFDKLRKISGPIDLDVTVFARLAPIASELGYKADWRVAEVPAKDIGKRPDLNTLGPFRWSPSPAPAWTLQDADGKTRSSTEFAGKPHVLIFYLGYECLHCAEQLQAFAPKVKEFEEAGLGMMAISTDDIKGLKISIDNYDKGKMPIPLVSDAKLQAFKAFRAFDDFEKQPLHGTFIIDASGMVLWQDISYEPFMDPKYVLKEAKRLLSQ